MSVPRADLLRLTAGLALLALGTAAAEAWEPTPPPRLGLELPRQERQRRIIRELLGGDRWRRLNAARFDVSLYDLDFTPELAEDPARHDEVARVLLQSLLKVPQRRLQLRLEERRDELRRRLRGGDVRRPERGARQGLSLRVSPRLRWDRRPWLGTKLRLAGARGALWSRSSLRLGSELDGFDPSLKLAFDGDSMRALVEVHTDDRHRGEAIELQLGFSF